MFHVVVHRSGSRYDLSRPLEEQTGWEAHASFMDGLVDAGFIILGGPLADEYRVVHVVEADSEDDIRATFARDPWHETHLRIDTIEPWTIRLDGRRPSRGLPGTSSRRRGRGAAGGRLARVPVSR